MEKIRFALLGYGHIGKRHAEMISKNAACELAAIIDTNENIKNAIPEGVVYYQKLEDYLSSGPKADIAIVATPNGLHASQALQAIQSGMHVVVEKPFGLHKKECEEVIVAADKMNKKVFCVMQNRYSPPSQWLKKIISEQLLGDIYMVQVNCFWNRDERYYKQGSWHGTKQLDGGVLFTQFSHFIDLLYWVFGDINNIQTNFNNFNHQRITEFDDSGMVHFDFINGGVGAINFSTSVWDKNLESSMTVIGKNGSLKIGGQYMDKVEYCHIKDYTMPELAATNPPNDYGMYKGSAANHSYVIQNVVDVLNNNAAITTEAFEGLKVVDIIERIYNCKNKQ
ncbi:MAG: Gfo/Idh/MocA family oxidoreductase [Bacteroidetes bacterium]|nr:Gfo/Idh/MocA family oxidoreductase [Bacteroidota bacterium]